MRLPRIVKNITFAYVLLLSIIGDSFISLVRLSNIINIRVTWMKTKSYHDHDVFIELTVVPSFSSSNQATIDRLLSAAVTVNYLVRFLTAKWNALPPCLKFPAFTKSILKYHICRSKNEKGTGEETANSTLNSSGRYGVPNASSAKTVLKRVDFNVRLLF